MESVNSGPKSHIRNSINRSIEPWVLLKSECGKVVRPHSVTQRTSLENMAKVLCNHNQVIRKRFFKNDM